MQGHTLEAGRQGTVADDVDLRAAEVHAAGGQGSVGEACLDVGQAQLAPLALGVAAFFGQRTVVARAWTSARCATVVGRQVLAVAFQRDGVVGRQLSAEADGTLGEARVVLDDGALHPVDTTISVDRLTVFFVLELAPTLELFVGVPVTGTTVDLLAFDETGGLGLCIVGVHGDRVECLALRFGISGGRNAADGQCQQCCVAQFHQ
ncbi:hypothetical protein D3C78_1274530 [compost metagenome]